MPPTNGKDEIKRKRCASPTGAASNQGDGARASAPTTADATPQQKKQRKWARLLLRELYDLGYCEAAATLEREASVQLRSPAMTLFQAHVSAQQWDRALQFIVHDDASDDGAKLHMKSAQATREAALLLLQRKYISLLLEKQVNAALRVFQDEILPVYTPSEREVMQMAQLLLCKDGADMQERAAMPWQDDELCARIESLVSADEIVPEGALRQLVQEAAAEELQAPPPKLMGPVTGECSEILLKHTSDVWELAFSPDGKFLASASRDGSIVLWELAFEAKLPPYGQLKQKSKVSCVFQSFDGPVECLAWSPDSQALLSSGKWSSLIQLWSPRTGGCQQKFQHPAGGVTKVQWLSGGLQFVSGSADKSLVLWNAADAKIVYQWGGRRVLDLAAHPYESKLFVLMSGHEIRVYDMAHKSDELFLEVEHLISCIDMSSSGKFLLVNCIKKQEIVCVSTDDPETALTKYRGLREQRYVLRPCFGGNHSELVVSGSEDGKLYVWHRDSGKLLTALDGHSSVVNVVRRHPVYGNVLASASDDETVRFWLLKSSA